MAQRQKRERQIKELGTKIQRRKIRKHISGKELAFPVYNNLNFSQGVRTTLLRVMGIVANCLLQRCKAHM